MRHTRGLAPLALAAAAHAAAAGPGAPVANPAIDAAALLRVAAEAARHREARPVDEAAFIAMSGEPGTVILDARTTRIVPAGTQAAAVRPR